MPDNLRLRKDGVTLVFLLSNTKITEKYCDTKPIRLQDASVAPDYTNWLFLWPFVNRVDDLCLLINLVSLHLFVVDGCTWHTYSRFADICCEYTMEHS